MPPTGKPDGPTLETLAKAIAEQGELLKQLADRLNVLEAKAATTGELLPLVSSQAHELDSQFRDFAKQTSEIVLSIQHRLPKPPQPKPDPLIH